MAATNARASLLSLPPELRNRIYHFALSPATTTHLDAPRRPDIPPLLITNRQIRQEAFGLYFHLLVLKLELTYLDCPILAADQFSSWMGQLRRVEKIRRIEVIAGSKEAIELFRGVLLVLAMYAEWYGEVGQGVIKMGYMDVMDPAGVDGVVWVQTKFLGEEGCEFEDGDTDEE
ncbi:uncharacterized protein CLAFUR5_04146 [Fulvia fulva]|uniref:Uncharacterized protein n=1 Tax=Passalora fulva TaxID=5499 RepID=A0A9Q8P877_PASFU|nr:uncharacterized protein CLAFUR5_04146 [Fulvia fulva]UJO16874.1 hypothetical protein CLAFUR5_04146 [Fulvia fulva]